MLATSMDYVEKTGKSFVSTEKALATIAAQSEPAFADAMKQEAPANQPEMELVNVTHTVFTGCDVKLPELPKSQISIYQGIIANLMSWGRDDFGGRLCGIMAGDGKSVTDVIMCKDLPACISADVTTTRWKSLNIYPMGLVMWKNDEIHSVDPYMPLLQSLDTPFQQLVFVFMCGGADPIIWDVSISDANVVTHWRCSGPKNDSGRKKDHKYRVVDFQALGKNTEAQMKETMRAYFQESMNNKFQKKLDSLASSPRCQCAEFTVPADGLCFWHAVLAAIDFETWSSIPRHENGYAKNKRSLKHEEDRAKALMNLAMEKATRGDVDKGRITEIQTAGGCVDLGDLKWICIALGINVRCTISDEAFLGVLARMLMSRVRGNSRTCTRVYTVCCAENKSLSLSLSLSLYIFHYHYICELKNVFVYTRVYV